MSDAVWMYQLNPKRGRFMIDGEWVPTTAENLWQCIEDPEDWGVAKNHLRADVDDPVVVKISKSWKGEASGIVALGKIAEVDPDAKTVVLEFDLAVTRALMDHPIPLERVQQVIPKDQSNLVDVSAYADWLRSEILARMPELPAERPYDPDGEVFAPNEFLVPSLLQQQMHLDRENDEVRALIRKLAGWLREEGYTELMEAPAGYHLRAKDQDGRGAFFQCAPGDQHVAAHFAVIAAVAANDARLRYGTGWEQLYVLTERPLSHHENALVESLGAIPMQVVADGESAGFELPPEPEASAPGYANPDGHNAVVEEPGAGRPDLSEPLVYNTNRNFLTLMCRPHDALDLLLAVLRQVGDGGRLPPGQEWVVTLNENQTHWRGYGTWIGFDERVPAAVADAYQAVAARMIGDHIEREYTIGSQAGLTPVLRCSEAGLELLVDASHAPDIAAFRAQVVRESGGAVGARLVAPVAGSYIDDDAA